MNLGTLTGLGLLVLGFILIAIVSFWMSKITRKITYPFEKNGSERLAVISKTSWNDMEIWVDGNHICSIPDRNELLPGILFYLADGSCLKLQLVHYPYSFGLQITRNGEPLPSSGRVTLIN